MGNNESNDTIVLVDVDDVDVQFRVNPSERTISGLIMPWGKVAQTEFRRWRFQRGSIRWSQPISRVKLLRDHDTSQPIGAALALEDREDGLYGTFRIRRGKEGDEVLELAEDEILDGLSAGVAIPPSGMRRAEEGVNDVHSAWLRETTVTAMPAFDDARVQRIAASLRINEEANMGDKNDDGQGHDHKATVLDNEDAGLERFRAELDQRFDALAEKLGESQEAQQESVAKIITASFETAFKALEDSGASHRAEMAAARIQVLREEPVYRFDGSPRSNSFVRDWWRAQTERDYSAIERLRKYQDQQGDMVKLLQKMPPNIRAQFAVDTTSAVDVIPPGYRPDLFVNELMQGRPIVAQASRGTITDATPFTVPRFVSATSATADHAEGVNPTPGDLTLDAVTVSPGAVSGRFELTREIVDAANPAIDAIALAAMRESYNQQAEVKAYNELDGTALTANTEEVSLNGDLDTDLTITPARDLLARFPFSRFAPPTGAFMGQFVTRNFVRAKDGTAGTGSPIVPSIGAQNRTATGNAVQQAWSVDGLAFVPAWAVNDTENHDVAVILNRTDFWVWESPLLTFRFEEKSGPAIIELALFAYFATKVLRPAGIFALRATA